MAAVDHQNGWQKKIGKEHSKRAVGAVRGRSVGGLNEANCEGQDCHKQQSSYLIGIC